MPQQIIDGYYWLLQHIPTWVYIAIVSHLAILGTVAYLILLERKIASWVQDRIGPNRVGLGFGIIPVLKDMKMFGLGQPLADGIKFILKEDYRAKNVDKILFTLAPAIMIIVIIISIAVVPWGGTKQSTATLPITPSAQVNDSPAATAAAAQDALPPSAWLVPNTPITAVDTDRDGIPDHVTVTYQYKFQAADLNIGVLYVLATLSLAVYGVVIGGWASNNKYSFLGGLRATANMISYEVPLGLCILCVVILYGTLDMGVIIDKQVGYWHPIPGVSWVGIPMWNVFTQPLAFVLFLICIHAEANRAPFDTAEAEQELVGGYHTEYSAMRFALFFLAEYAGMVTTSCVCVALFFGGWHLPLADRLVGWVQSLITGRDVVTNGSVTSSFAVCLVRAVIFFTKAILVLSVFMWVRWSLPRFRFDQIMQLAWRALIPITLALTMATAIVVYLNPGNGVDATPTVDGISGKVCGELLLMNVVVGAGIMLISLILPAAPDTNRRMRVRGSRYGNFGAPPATA